MCKKTADNCFKQWRALEALKIAAAIGAAIIAFTFALAPLSSS